MKDIAPAQPPTLSVAKARYPLHTYSVVRPINLKATAEALFPGITERFDADCLIFHISAVEKIFIFNFGTVVFLNIPLGAHVGYLSHLGLSQAQRSPTASGSESEPEIAEDEVNLTVEEGKVEVAFNTATIPAFDMSYVQLVALVLAQSSALELLEWEVEEFLAQSDRFSGFLKGTGLRRPTRKELLKFLGRGLSAKHRIVSQLSLLNEPDRTWEREEMYRLYRDLQNNFDIRDRVEKVEKMLAITSEASNLLLEIVNTRRAEFLELIIILLILFEVIKSFID